MTERASEQYPESWEPLPWHQSAWARLSAARRAGRLPHALLLEGAAGLGKRRLAQRLAASLLCAAPGSELDPCGACRSCHLLGAGTHPAFRLLEPEEGGGQIRVDTIRECVARDGLTSQAGGYKVTLIQPAEAMNPAAANAFLKTLEEPAPWTLTVLISEQPSRLSATIRSRCQQIALAAPPESMAVHWLAPRVKGVDPALLVALGAGAPIRAQGLASEEILALRDRRFEEFRGVVQGWRDPVLAAQDWQGEDLDLTLEWLSGWALDLARLQVSEAPPSVFNPDRTGPLRTLASELSGKRLHELLLKTLEARRALQTQLNPHLLLEDLLLEWAREARTVSRPGRDGGASLARQAQQAHR